MANIRFGGGIADARGSIGGMVLSRGRGGAVASNRTKGVNPRSTLQVARRNVMATVAARWSGTLTTQQRADWNAYAAGTSWTNKLGDSINIGGNAAMARLNSLLNLAGLPYEAAAPTALGHAATVLFGTFTADDSGEVIVSVPSGAGPWTAAGLHALLFLSAPRSPGREGAPTAFQFVAAVAAANPTPFPKTITSPYTLAAGQRLWLKTIVIDADNRVSADVFQEAIVVAD